MRLLLINDVIAQACQVGVEVEPVISRLPFCPPLSCLGFKTAPGPVIFNSVQVEMAEVSGKVVAIIQADEKVEV